jgi:hypothetical protein
VCYGLKFLWFWSFYCLFYRFLSTHALFSKLLPLCSLYCASIYLPGFWWNIHLYGLRNDTVHRWWLFSVKTKVTVPILFVQGAWAIKERGRKLLKADLFTVQFKCPSCLFGCKPRHRTSFSCLFYEYVENIWRALPDNKSELLAYGGRWVRIPYSWDS